jgi:hypothetical protein
MAETVDAPGNVGEHSSIAVDSQGNPHIAYQDRTNSDLKYARKSGGVWAVEVVDSDGFLGAYASLALDSQDNPHVSYERQGNPDRLTYAHKSAGVWTIEEALNGNLLNTSLALDSQGNPHIGYKTYVNIADGDLKYARKSGGVWTSEFVESSGDAGQDCSLVLDSQDNPHLAYRRHTPGLGDWELKYAFKSGGLWTREIADGDDDGGIQRASLALNTAGEPRIATGTSSNPHLRYVRRDSGIWTSENVNTNNQGGSYPSLRFDSNDDPHIAFGGSGGTTYAVDRSITSVPDVASATRFSFGAPYPNPALHGSSSFLLQLERADVVVLELFDTSGRLVARRSPEPLPAGTHRVDWSADVSVPGVYFARARTGHSGELAQRWTILGRR